LQKNYGLFYAETEAMRIIPCLRGAPAEYNGASSAQPSGAPIMQLKELEPDWGRYNAWKHSLQEPYWDWRNRILRQRSTTKNSRLKVLLSLAEVSPPHSSEEGR
jgi:hypothetical protein